MRLKNIECQLAQGQIGRYLAGTDMSAEAVTQLELHIAECDDCTRFVEEKRRELKEMAGKTRAVAYIEDSRADEEPLPRLEASKPAAEQALINAIREKSGIPKQAVVLETRREPAAAKPIRWKAFAYSGALGLVLLVMSHLTANPTALFGERAIKADPAPSTDTQAAPVQDRDPFQQTAEAPTTPTTGVTRAQQEATGSAAKPSADSISQPVGPAKTSTSEVTAPAKTISAANTPPNPKVRVTSTRIVRRSPRRIRKPNRAPAPQQRGSSIRVYDEKGRLISGA